ncbi:hypothetical protein [Chondromyces apiculatus]|uniref:Uncharacterized protein n=1 Tax=Chondromyces apiculatus DSM 436 TaxID=1192034 RepID=A0A017T0E1_9BACT|nr:hypothetical protein [Chondromyces apiculatus]EYF02467.1 Hypothetical protein CAP_7089 [Chondromyces apiculatus DSM 436]
MEAWWFLWPDAVKAANQSWRKPDDYLGKNVGMIRDAKEELKRRVVPRGAKPGRGGFRGYTDADAPRIAAEVSRLGIADKPGGQSGSYDRFRRSVAACKWWPVRRAAASPAPPSAARGAGKEAARAGGEPMNCLQVSQSFTLVAGLLSAGVTGCVASADGAALPGPEDDLHAAASALSPSDPAALRTFDHGDVDLADIPQSCLDHLKANVIVHYGHRSHGSQITHGAKSLRNKDAKYGFQTGYMGIPNTPGALRVWAGMVTTDAVSAAKYWDSEAGLNELRTILTNNPSIRYSAWAWSFEISSQTQATIDDYLTTMNSLEQEFPDVTFIYMTGTAEETYNGANRKARNQQIRSYAQANGKILYDHEDLDAWSGDERYSLMLGGVEVPMEHPDWNAPDTNGYNYSHATQASCENKARAFWVMLATLEGCMP